MIERKREKLSFLLYIVTMVMYFYPRPEAF
jgi:hypothetical protein